MSAACNHQPFSFAGYTFDGTKGSYACSHVWTDKAAVHLFVHDPDGSLQFLCGETSHDPGDCVYLHALHILDEQPDLYDLPVVDPGFEAERERPDAPWVVIESEPYDA